MKNIRIFLSENFPFSVVKFSVYLNRRVFITKLPSFGYTDVLVCRDERIKVHRI